MGSSAKLLKEYIGAIKETHRRKLWIFDFDDTLVKTDGMTHVTASNGQTFDLTPHELSIHDKQPGETFDYSDFQKLINPRPIKWMNKILRSAYQHHGPNNVVILSARSTADPIERFLVDVGLTVVGVTALDDTNPLVKSAWIDARLTRDRPDIVEFFDDSDKNVVAVNELQHKHPNVEIITHHIVHNRINSLVG